MEDRCCDVFHRGRNVKLIEIRERGLNWAEKIVEQIKENIGRGNFAAGDKLPSEREMAEQMGVSRSSIREALQILEHTGFLEVIQGRGTFINEIGRESLTDPLWHLLKNSESSYRDVYEFRLAIEVWAAGKAAERITDEQANNLKEIINYMCCIS